MHQPSSQYQIRRTRNGYRLIQHGVVLSEMRDSPGATDSVFDVLAALVAVLCPTGRLGVLGFASGSMVAPLRGLGLSGEIETCDLDVGGYELFQKHCGHWAGSVRWTKADANRWVQSDTGRFDVLVDDLSVPIDDDVFKPECSWTTLPRLMRSKLRRGGVVVANQLKPFGGSWRNGMRVFENLFAQVQVVYLDDFENRIVIAGEALPPVREAGSRLRERLLQLESSQAGRVRIRTWLSTCG